MPLWTWTILLKISAPNHSGKGRDLPPPFGQCPNRPCIFLSGASLTKEIGEKCYCVHIGIRAAKSSYFQLLKQLQLRLTKNQNQKQLQLTLMKNQSVHRTAPKSKSTGFSQSKQQLKMCTAGRSVVWRYLFAVNKKIVKFCIKSSYNIINLWNFSPACFLTGLRCHTAAQSGHK